MGSFWCWADHLEWEALSTWLVYSDWATEILIMKIRHKHFLTKTNVWYYDRWTAIKNYGICNWLRSCNDPYAFTDFKSHFVLPEYCNQCLADKTDHLKWEGFDAGLTILNGKPLGFDYYILAGWLKNWSRKVFWQFEARFYMTDLIFEIITQKYLRIPNFS